MKGSHNTGFTLIELLVVIAIISLLIALLLPVLAHAKHEAKIVLCATQLRQMAIGATTYAHDETTMYPKRGAMRNSAYGLKDRNRHDIIPSLRPYYKVSLDNMTRCPFLEKTMRSGDSNSSYSMLFNTKAAPVVEGPIGSYQVSHMPRIVQYDINGNMIADATSWSALRTWYWSRFDPDQMMRKLDDTWTSSRSGNQYTLLGSDFMLGRGHPLRTRTTNHPSPSEAWKRSSDGWRGYAMWDPATSGNYVATDGHVRRFNYPGKRYYHDPAPDYVEQVSHVGYVPDHFFAGHE